MGKDGAAEVAMMKGMMKPWIKRLKKMSCNVCEGSRAGGESFKEIIARQEEDDVAEKSMMKGMTASIMQKLIENLRWMMRTMIFCPICQGGPGGGPGGEGGEDSFTEIA